MLEADWVYEGVEEAGPASEELEDGDAAGADCEGEEFDEESWAGVSIYNRAVLGGQSLL